MSLGFESIASYYDGLVLITSGNLLFKNAISLFSRVKKTSNVLVIGDGSGRITEQFLKQHVVDTLYYVELSPTLITKAENRFQHLWSREKLPTQIHFFNQDILDCDFPEKSFDMVLTPYFLDLWSEIQLEQLMTHISPSLKVGGVWYVSDFNPEVNHMPGLLGFVYRGFIKMLYLFFNWSVKLKTNRLPDMGIIFNRLGYHLESQNKKLKGLLLSMIWTKIS